MEKYSIDFNDYEPKYVQIAENIKKLINSRIIKDGDKLPPIRELSKALKVNNVTVVNCYNKLVSEGYAYQKMGSGTFAKKREIVDYFKKEYSKEIKLIKNKYDSNNNSKSVISQIISTQTFDNLYAKSRNDQRLTDTRKNSR